MESQELSNNFEKTLKNEYVFWIIMLFGIVFGWLARPPIPNWLLKLFENPFFQYAVLFGIVYTGSKNLKAAFISPLIFMFLMYLLSLGDKQTISQQNTEGFRGNRYRPTWGGSYENDEADQVDEEEEEDQNDDEQNMQGENVDVEDPEVVDEQEQEEFADQDTEQERRKLAFELHKGISDVSKSSSELYQTATSLIDTYSPEFDGSTKNRTTNATKNNTTTEAFYNYGSCL